MTILAWILFVVYCAAVASLYWRPLTALHKMKNQSSLAKRVAIAWLTSALFYVASLVAFVLAGGYDRVVVPAAVAAAIELLAWIGVFFGAVATGAAVVRIDQRKRQRS